MGPEFAPALEGSGRAKHVASWELFDRQTDPKELTSVFGKPDYAGVQKELEAELARLRKELKVPDPDPAETVIRQMPKKKKEAKR